MRITIIGTGYVGLVTGACFSEMGNTITCVDSNKRKIDNLIQGIIPIYEPGLEKLILQNVKTGRLSFSTSLKDSMKKSNLFLIAVGTPESPSGKANMEYVYNVAREIGENLKRESIIVNKSTVLVGTAEKVQSIIMEELGKRSIDVPFHIVSNPEFLKEGDAIRDFMRPDRVVIGVENKRAENVLKELYHPINLIEVPLLLTDLESAEIIKYASNTFLATKISFINEMSVLCEEVGADIHAVAKGMGLDGRINRKFLHPGPGYGGSCFPKDTQALVRIAQEHGVSSRIVKAVIEVNEAQKVRMIKKIRNALDGNEGNKTIAVLGLTFKPETDDMRDAPSLTILPKLIENGCQINAHDPKGISEAKTLLPSEVRYYDDVYSAIENADAVVLMTEWNHYRGLDLTQVKRIMSGNIFIDLRNVYEPDQMLEAGFNYFCVGR